MLRNLAVGLVTESENVEQLVGAQPDRRWWQAPHLAEEQEQLARCQTIEQDRLRRHEAEHAAGLERVCDDVQAADLGRPGVRSRERREHPDQGGLAGAVRSGDAEEGALRHLEVEPIDRDRRAEALLQ